MYDGGCYPNGSYFYDSSLNSIDLICGDTSGTGGGQVILPDGNTCTASTSPIRCTHDDTHNTSIIRIRNVGSFNKPDDELAYQCSLPHSCSNDNTHMITANIFGKVQIIKYNDTCI